MLYVAIGACFVISFILIYVPDIMKKNRVKNYVIKCKICGSTDTVYKNNDVKETFLWSASKETAVQKNPASFICNCCKKEYDLSENGAWVKKTPVKKEKSRPKKERDSRYDE